MTARSTRQKLKDRVGCIDRDLNKCIIYLYEITEMSQGRTPTINNYAPRLALAIEEIIKAVKIFRSEL